MTPVWATRAPPERTAGRRRPSSSHRRGRSLFITEVRELGDLRRIGGSIVFGAKDFDVILAVVYVEPRDRAEVALVAAVHEPSDELTDLSASAMESDLGVDVARVRAGADRARLATNSWGAAAFQGRAILRGEAPVLAWSNLADRHEFNGRRLRDRPRCASDQETPQRHPGLRPLSDRCCARVVT